MKGVELGDVPEPVRIYSKLVEYHCCEITLPKFIPTLLKIIRTLSNSSTTSLSVRQNSLKIGGIFSQV